MNADEKKDFLENCQEQLDELTHMIAQLQEQVKPIAPDVGLGRLTRMEAIQAKSVNEATLQDLLAKKQNIEIRMQQIDSPGFGNCAKCGNGIAPARLAYLPESDLCVGCA